MYDKFFFPSNDSLFDYVSKYGPSWPLLNEYRGCKTPTPIGRLNDNVSILISTKRVKNQVEAESVHFILRETQKALRKDFCRITPFFKPEGGFLWHASLDYGAERMPLDFVVANAFQGDAFDLCSKGGVFQMRFMGLGESLECMNDKGVIRMWGGKIVARERREKDDPSIDHVDVVFSEARSLNPCGDDKANPAFAEFTSTIENVSPETICGQPCYRIRLWSGPLEEPSSFPWTLLIAKCRVQKGYIPRVGDFVNGIAAMYGTFDDKAGDGAEPTVFQPKGNPGDWTPEPPISEKDIPKAPKGKPETEWLPRRPKNYPDAPAPRVALPAFTDEPFKKFVTYPEYRRHIGKDLAPVAPPSRKRLREIIAEIDYKYTYVDNERWAFGRIFDAIGVRHAVSDKATGETHLWLCIPLVDIHYDSHAELMVSVGTAGHVARYTIYSNAGHWAHGEMWCEVNRDGDHDYTIHPTPEAALADIVNIKKGGFVILCAECTGNMFQAICTQAGSRKRYCAEWLLFGISWCRGKPGLSEKRLLELCRLFLSGGLPAIQNEEPWRKNQ